MLKLLLSRVPLFFGPEAKVGNVHTELHFLLDLHGAQCGAPYDFNSTVIFCMNSPLFQSKVFTFRMVLSWHTTNKCFMCATEKHAELIKVAKTPRICWNTMQGWKPTLKHFGAPWGVPWAVGCHVLPPSCAEALSERFPVGTDRSCEREHPSSKAGGMISSWVCGIILCPVFI